MASYTLTYNPYKSDSGTVPPPQTGSDTYVVSDNVGNLVLEDYTFCGWRLNINGTLYLPGSTIVLTANTSLWASFAYPISYDANGATSGTVPATQLGIYKAAGNPGNLARVGYIFAGWQTNPTGGTFYAPGDSVSTLGNTVLYAAWTAVYTVTYDANGAASGTVPTAQSGATSYTVPDNTGLLAKIGYHCEGWRTGPLGGTIYPPGSIITPVADTTLYANWVKVFYAVTYDANYAGAGAAPAQQTGATSYTVQGNTGSLAKTGCTFIGWNTNSIGTGTFYTAGTTITPQQNVTLYAAWQLNATTIPSTSYTLDNQVQLIGNGITINLMSLNWPKNDLTWAVSNAGLPSAYQGLVSSIGLNGVVACAGTKGFGMPSPDVYESAGVSDGGVISVGRYNSRPIEIPIFAQSFSTSKGNSREALNYFINRFLIAASAPNAYLKINNPFALAEGGTVANTYLTIPVVMTDAVDWTHGDTTDGYSFVKTVATFRCPKPFWTSSISITNSFTTTPNVLYVRNINPIGSAPTKPTIGVVTSSGTSLNTNFGLAFVHTGLNANYSQVLSIATTGTAGGAAGLIDTSSGIISGPLYDNSSTTSVASGISWVKLIPGEAGQIRESSMSNITSYSISYRPCYLAVI